MLILLLTSAPSHAQEEVCTAALSLAEWREAMDAVDESLAQLDGARADRVLDDIVDELRCVDSLVGPEDLGRLARQVSVVAFWQQDLGEMEVWGLLARKTLGGTEWPEALAVPDRYFELMDDTELPEPTLLEGKGLAVPDREGVLLDGWLAVEPAAEVGTQHFVQVTDRKGRVVWGSWMDGNRWDPRWLHDTPGPRGVPDWYSPAPEPPPWEPWGGDAVVEAAEPAEPEPAEPEPAAPEPAAPEPAAPEPAEPEPVTGHAGLEGDVSAATEGKLRLIAERRNRPPPAPVTFDGDGVGDDCPWKGRPRNVSAGRKEVKVNRHSYPIKSDDDQAAFKKTLRSCGEYRAARRFTRWQDARGLFSSGAQYRDGMVEALLTEEPTRNKKKKKGG